MIKSFKALIDGSVFELNCIDGTSYQSNYNNDGKYKGSLRYDVESKECKLFCYTLNGKMNYVVHPIKILNEYYLTFFFNNDIQKVPITFTEYTDDSLIYNYFNFKGYFNCGEDEYYVQINHVYNNLSIFIKNTDTIIAKRNFVLVEKLD